MLLLSFFESVIFFSIYHLSIFVRLPRLLKTVTRRWSKEKVFVVSTVTINFKFFSSSNISIMQLVSTCIRHDPQPHCKNTFFASIYTDISRQLCKWNDVNSIPKANPPWKSDESSVTSLVPEYTLWNCNTRFILHLSIVKDVLLSTFQFQMLT